MAYFRSLRRRLERVFPQDRSYGTAVRDHIHVVTLTLHPYVVKVIPNFRAAHYTYILFMTFFTSVIVYPITGFRYIDILFLMSGALTQAGLNTVNLNELRLSQQIIVYITATLTTPIFIHGLLLFIRLYWFERYFDNIKELLKLNFRMRRNATLAARTRSMDRTAANTMTNQGQGGPVEFRGQLEPNQLQTRGAPADDLHVLSEDDPLAKKGQMELSSDQLKLTSHELPTMCPSEDENEDQSGSGSDSDSDNDIHHEIGFKLDHASDTGSEVDPKDPHPAIKALGPPTPENTPMEGIKFADLPKPTKRTQEIDPSDMYKSIALLQQNKRRDSGLSEDVLVIKLPNEIERELNTPIYTTKINPLHFPSRKSKWLLKKHRHKTRWDALRRTISNSLPLTRRRPVSMTNDHDSIDSEHDATAMTEDDASLNLQNNTSIHSYNSSDEHAVLESDDDAEKEPKKLLFKDSYEGDRKTKFAQEPTIDRQKRQARQGRGRLRKWRTPGVSGVSSRTYTDNSIALDDDEEEDDYGAPLAKAMSTNYLSWTPTIGRNSTFVHLTEDQKEELGGVEYRAIKLLIKIIFFFYVGFHVIAFCLYVGFINVAKGYAKEMRAFGVSPTWWGFFTAQSVFNDLGLTLTPNSMLSYSRSVYILVISCFFIVIGNTGFPIFLRFIIWVMFKTAKPLSLYKESLGFLLDHPRRCFTLLFPSIPTWWLFFILVVLNATDLILFIILDLNSKYLKSIPVGFRVLDGLFQAFSTRTAGFSVIDLSQLHPAVQVSYMIMMYISVLPLAISIRRTNVYEEQSLGVYLKADETDNEIESTPKNFIGTHLRNQLSFDLWFVFLGLFVICIAEGGKIEAGDLRFTVFSILFEIISAYGTVGLSLGYPNVDQSLSYRFTTLSKLVIIAMMIRGRHRGLPYSLDRAIILPDSDMQKRDMVQENHASQRAESLSVEPTVTSFNDNASEGFTDRLRRTISKKALQYRRNSLFPAPTRLPEELHEMRSFSRGQ